jgi:hypothetical protein
MSPRMTQAEVDAYNARRKAHDAGTSIGEAVEREMDLHDEILRECARRSWIAIHPRMDMASTVRIGTPDFLVLANDGRMLMVECKNRLGKLSPDQQAFKAWAERLGHTIHICRSFAHFIAIADQTAFSEMMVNTPE